MGFFGFNKNVKTTLKSDEFNELFALIKKNDTRILHLELENDAFRDKVLRKIQKKKGTDEEKSEAIPINDGLTRFPQ